MSQKYFVIAELSKAKGRSNLTVLRRSCLQAVADLALPFYLKGEEF